MSDGYELLTNAEMAEADRRAIVAGVASLELMEAAGAAVADTAARMCPDGGHVAILCGPGNNGGDGFVAARLLRERGYVVRLSCVVPCEMLSGDAAEMARRWTGATEPLAPASIEGADLIVDALFGAGISRPIGGPAADVVARANASGIPILAVDVPSGLDGTTGQICGQVAMRATRTITFFRRKPGHVLMPGRALCGEVTVADIGIPDQVLVSTPDQAGLGGASVNAPRQWLPLFPVPVGTGHKYSRGHAVVVSGPAEATGAARLGARGALRAGAGLVSVASPRDAVLVNAAHLTAIMLVPFEAPTGLAQVLEDRRRNTVLIGPGCGVGRCTREMVVTCLGTDKACVLDADALTSFATDADDTAPATAGSFGFLTPAATDAPAAPRQLFDAIRAKSGAGVVITPHEGEFRRLFPSLEGSKLDRARQAAVASGAIVVLKGPDTVIASPSGRAAINENAPPWLATAGAGDVLAGFIAGLLAQGMPPFESACAGVWLHGACATAFGPGLIAEDLPEMLPKVLQQLLSGRA